MKALQDKQQKAIQELANGNSVVGAARATGVSEQTLHLWKRKPEFQEALRTAKEALDTGRLKVIESISAERTRVSFPDVNAKLEQGGLDAIDFLTDLINNPDARTRDRLDAAKELIKLSGITESQKIFVQSETIQTENRKKGLTPETAAAIRRHILGINEDVIEKVV